jgi:4-amino-4-deoxy-L-arabinose transferase-like glycosyltransferase
MLVFFGMVGLGVWYDLAAFKNLSTIEGMDAAQLGRNLSKGDGFTTQFVRPFSMHLVQKHRADGDALLAERHPDLANAPLYPLLLAGVLKAMPFGYPDTTAVKQFSVYAPDLWIAIFNQLLFFFAVWLVFRLGRRLFDESVAWVSAAVFAGTDLFWRFSVSGLSTMLLIVIFLAIIEVLSRVEPQTREGATRSEGWVTRMAVAAGVLAGLAGLTRYSFGWIIVPVVAFLAMLPTPRRPVLVMSCIAMFLVVMAPWVVRNFFVSGTPFGTAGYALFQNTSLFSGLDLERTINPDFSLMTGADLWRKLVVGTREIIEKELPRLGGSWVSAFFLVGLLVPFRNPTLSRLRVFVMIALLVAMVAQALGRTGLSADSLEVNSENLLVVFAPAVFLFGVSLFFVLLEQFGLKTPAFRLFAMSAFTLLASLPLVFTLLMPEHRAWAYPPYYPPYIQEKAQWVEGKDLVMADFPWAVAWYGDRQSVWLSLKYREDTSLKFRNDFQTLNNQGKPIRALYLSARTVKSIETQALEPWMQGVGAENWEEAVSDWDSFVLLGAYLKHEVPTGFPLKRAPFGLHPELFLADSERNTEKSIKGK